MKITYDMTITRLINGEEVTIELTEDELFKAYSEYYTSRVIEDAMEYLKDNYCGGLQNVLVRSDYREIAERFEDAGGFDAYECDALLGEVVEEYIKKDLKHSYAVADWGYISITVEDRLVFHDESGEFISYIDVNRMNKHKRNTLFNKCRKALQESDEAYAKFIFDNVGDLELLDKCENGKYEAAIEDYGEVYVNKIGNYFVVAEEYFFS